MSGVFGVVFPQAFDNRLVPFVVDDLPGTGMSGLFAEFVGVFDTPDNRVRVTYCLGV